MIGAVLGGGNEKQVKMVEKNGLLSWEGISDTG